MEKERGVDRLSRYIIYGVAAAIALAAGWYFRNVIIYVILAAVVSLLGKPVMNLLRHVKIRKKSMPESVDRKMTSYSVRRKMGLAESMAA